MVLNMVIGADWFLKFLNMVMKHGDRFLKFTLSFSMNKYPVYHLRSTMNLRIKKSPESHLRFAMNLNLV